MNITFATSVKDRKSATIRKGVCGLFFLSKGAGRGKLDRQKNNKCLTGAHAP